MDEVTSSVRILHEHQHIKYENVVQKVVVSDGLNFNN